MDRTRRPARSRGDLCLVLGLAVLAACFLAPALKDGLAFGPFDFDLSLTPITAGLFPQVHSPYNGDAVSQMIAWNAFDWRMVHEGHFPLWNSYSVLGMPEFFNFESSVLSLPDLVSYAVPLNFAFTVVVFVKLVLAGTGAYLFGRVLGLCRIASFFAGATFMFSGAFASWLTWPLSDVAAWSGWIFAFAMLSYRTKQARYVVLLAIAVAFSVYGGFPEANVMFAVVFLAAAVAAGLALLVSRNGISVSGLVRVGGGGIAGVALSAPLWLPGLSVISGAHRTTEGNYVGLPLRTLPLLFSQGYFGLPIGAKPSPFQLPRWNYYETVSYVGIVALVLAAVAVCSDLRRGRVIALAFALLFSLGFVYEPVSFHPLQSVADHLGLVTAIRFERMRIFTEFLVAMLAGAGLDVLVRRAHERSTRLAFLVSALAGTTGVGLALVAADNPALSLAARSERLHALVWPTVLSGGLLVLAVIWFVVHSSPYGRALRALIVSGGVAFSFFAGVGIPSYARSAYPSTPAVLRLQSIVKGSLVGLDGGNTTSVRSFAHLGFYPNVNVGYGVHLFAVHDPMVPLAYFRSWPFAAAAPTAFGVGLFTPDVNSVGLARRYGIGYVLVAPGLPAPGGMKKVATIQGERLYRVPGSSPFGLAGGRPGTVAYRSVDGGGGYVVNVAAKQGSTLLLAVSDVPGWHASVDGRAVGLRRYDEVMMKLSLAPGSHVVRLSYWPRRYSEGLALAAAAALVLLAYYGLAREITRHQLRSLFVRSGAHSRSTIWRQTTDESLASEGQASFFSGPNDSR